MLHRSPREFGYESSLWTSEMAAETAFEEGLTEKRGADSVNQAWLRLALWGVVAIVVVVVYGSQHLSRKHRKEEPVQPGAFTPSPRVV
jgi:anti-sigma-K factor RskA